MKPFVVILDSYDERNIRSVNCYVFAEDEADAEMKVIDWLKNIYHNTEALRVRKATEEERKSSSYWA